MNNAALFALLGTVLGSLITLWIGWFQNRSQAKRDYIEMAYELARLEYTTVVENAKVTKKYTHILPVESYLLYYMKYIELVKKRGFNINDMKELRDFGQEINAFYAASRNNAS